MEFEALLRVTFVISWLMFVSLIVSMVELVVFVAELAIGIVFVVFVLFVVFVVFDMLMALSFNEEMVELLEYK